MAALILPALFIIAAAAAQCSTSGTTTISAPSEATALASCLTYSGSVVIPSGLAVPMDSDGLQTIQIDNVRKIDGNLTVTNVTQLSSLSFSSLQSVVGLELTFLQRLTTLSFPQLTTVDALNFNALPALQNLAFGGRGITKARSVLVTNTGLTTLQGIDNLEEVDLFDVNNNVALTNISLQVSSIKTSLTIAANDEFLSGLSTSFPLLETALNMTFRNCSQILLPSLKNVTDELGFYGNTFTNFSASKLTSAGGIIFVDNTDLVNITLPNLEKIDGAYQIANNTKLSIINGFPKLSIIGGTLDLSGNFSEVDLPALSQVAGGFNLQTSEKFDCSKFDEAHAGHYRGTYACNGSLPEPQTAGNKPSSTSDASGASKTGAASCLNRNNSLFIGISSLIVVILHLFL